MLRDESFYSGVKRSKAKVTLATAPIALKICQGQPPTYVPKSAPDFIQIGSLSADS